jgi:hypothetical protein
MDLNDAIIKKQDKNVGSENSGKILVVNSNGDISLSETVKQQNLELVDLTGTQKLTDLLKAKQPKITNNSALVGNDFNLYDEKFPTDKRLKALASGTQGTIVTTSATYNDLQKLAGIAEVTNNSLTTVKAVVDSKVNKTDLKKAITDSKGSTASETFTITLGNTTTGTQSITIPKATTNTAGLMTKTDKTNVDKIPNLLENNTAAADSDIKTFTVKAEKALLARKWEAFTDSNCINQTSKKIT